MKRKYQYNSYKSEVIVGNNVLGAEIRQFPLPGFPREYAVAIEDSGEAHGGKKRVPKNRNASRPSEHPPVGEKNVVGDINRGNPTSVPERFR